MTATVSPIATSCPDWCIRHVTDLPEVSHLTCFSALCRAAVDPYSSATRYQRFMNRLPLAIRCHAGRLKECRDM